MNNTQRKHKLSRKRHGIGGANVWICMPTPLDGRMSVNTAAFVMKALQRGIASWEPILSRVAEDARNMSIRETLEKHLDVTHIFFLDADNAPYNQFMIEKLLSHKKPVVAGISPTRRKPKNLLSVRNPFEQEMKEGKLRFTWNFVTEDAGKLKAYKITEKIWDEIPSQLFKARFVGCTGLLVRREVFTKIPQPWQVTRRDEIGGMVLSEDYDFCDKIAKAGYDIWIDPNEMMSHEQTFDLGEFLIPSELRKHP